MSKLKILTRQRNSIISGPVRGIMLDSCCEGIFRQLFDQMLRNFRAIADLTKNCINIELGEFHAFWLWTFLLSMHFHKTFAYVVCV